MAEATTIENGQEKTMANNITDILKASGCEMKRCDKDRNVVGDTSPEDFGQTVEQAQRLTAIAKELEHYSPEQKMEWAKKVKDAGNESYYKREIKEATAFYVDCLVALDLVDEKVKHRMRHEIQLPVTTNLAACMLEQGRNLKCAELCNVALGIDPTNIIAWTRKAVSHFRLLDYEDALHDFDEALKLLDEPSGQQYQRIMMYVNQIQRQASLEKRRARRAFSKLKLSELYNEKEDWKPLEKRKDVLVDDSDAAIAKILEKYRPLTWSAYGRSWVRCLFGWCSWRKRKKD